MFSAWQKFRSGKRNKGDVMTFEMHLEDNIFALYKEVKAGFYKHSQYRHFKVFDNKKRDIFKAEIRDRVMHQIIYDYLTEIFEPFFISDSYASRKNKGQYKALNALRYFIKLASIKRELIILKCDIRKYFDSVDQNILLRMIKEKIYCEKTYKIICEIIKSFHSLQGDDKGIPLGNVTSQIFANIYLSKLDQFVKKELKQRYYVRYNDDSVLITRNIEEAEMVRKKIINFVNFSLLLSIPLEKTYIQKIGRGGDDFVGFRILRNAILLRDKTKNKIFANINQKNTHSYFAILKHCNSYNLQRKLLVMEKIHRI